VLAETIRANLARSNAIRYDAREREFALRIQETLPDKVPLESVAQVHELAGGVSMGSTDVGDVSWVVPTAGFTTACWVPGTPAHSWQATACGGTSIARKGMQLAAKVLAASAWDLYHDPKRIEAA